MADTSHIWLARVSAAMTRGIAIARELSAWPFFGAPVPQARTWSAEPLRLSIADQWSHLSGIVMGAAARAEEATRCHASATLQLDLAQYALTSLVDELSAVMDMGGRRRRATVHVLGVASSPSLRPVGGAIAA